MTSQCLTYYKKLSRLMDIRIIRLLKMDPKKLRELLARADDPSKRSAAENADLKALELMEQYGIGMESLTPEELNTVMTCGDPVKIQEILTEVSERLDDPEAADMSAAHEKLIADAFDDDAFEDNEGLPGDELEGMHND